MRVERLKEGGKRNPRGESKISAHPDCSEDTKSVEVRWFRSENENSDSLELRSGAMLSQRPKWGQRDGCLTGTHLQLVESLTMIRESAP